ncbi:MAG: hypothetical protein MUO91_07155 [candidate division Zixibacteria bacterium]|nr:hypothetical protein [candidate division Zixibacteria bacterium]
MTKTELAVGDSTWIELIYTMGQHGGEVSKSATVTTNDTITGNINISFRGKGWVPSDTAIKLEVNPQVLDFGPLGKKLRMELETEMKNLSQEEMQLAIVGCPPEFFEKVELSKDKIKPNKKAKLEVRLKRESEDQRFQESITLEAKNKSTTYRFTLLAQKGYESKIEAKEASSSGKQKPDEK